MVQLAAGEERHYIGKRYIPAHTAKLLGVASAVKNLPIAQSGEASASTNVEGMEITGLA